MLAVMTAPPPPFWPTTAADWGSVAGSVVVVVAAGVALQQLAQAVKTRHASLFADLSRRWSEPPLEESQRLVGFYGSNLRRSLEIHFLSGDPETSVLLRSADCYE